jgi:hypothetical protein
LYTDSAAIANNATAALVRKFGDAILDYVTPDAVDEANDVVWDENGWPMSEEEQNLLETARDDEDVPWIQKDFGTVLDQDKQTETAPRPQGRFYDFSPELQERQDDATVATSDSLQKASVSKETATTAPTVSVQDSMSSGPTQVTETTDFPTQVQAMDEASHISSLSTADELAKLRQRIAELENQQASKGQILPQVNQPPVAAANPPGGSSTPVNASSAGAEVL